MKALVTGATGFIGANLVRELLKQDYQVRALVRKESSRRNIDGLRMEIAYGDLRDKESLDSALLKGVMCSSMWPPLIPSGRPIPMSYTKPMFEAPRTCSSAAMARGIKKVVYTSTESTIGIDRNGCLGTEQLQSDINKLSGHYKKSKLLAEQLALKMCQEGLPLVVVNPTTPVGSLISSQRLPVELIVRFSEPPDASLRQYRLESGGCRGCGQRARAGTGERAHRREIYSGQQKPHLEGNTGYPGADKRDLRPPPADSHLDGADRRL